MNFGRAVKKIRSLCGITQYDAEIQCRVSKAYFYKLEAGVRIPRIDTLVRVANGLGVSPLALILLALDEDEKAAVSEEEVAAVMINLLMSTGEAI